VLTVTAGVLYVDVAFQPVGLSEWLVVDVALVYPRYLVMVTMDETDDVTVTVVSVVAHVDQAPPDGPFAKADGANSSTAALRAVVTRMMCDWIDVSLMEDAMSQENVLARLNTGAMSCRELRVSCSMGALVEVLWAVARSRSRSAARMYRGSIARMN
jgi:hypothetical protein